MKAFVLAISLVGCTSGVGGSVAAESLRWERFNADLRAAVASGCNPEQIRHLVIVVTTLVGVVVGFALFRKVGRG